MSISLIASGMLGITMILHLILGTFVLRRDPGALLNRLFFGLAANVAFWCFAVLMVSLTSDYDAKLMWVRIAHAIAAMIPCFILALVYSFLDSSKQTLFANRIMAILFFFGLTLAVLCLTPLMIKDLTLGEERLDYLYGSLFNVYPVFFIVVTGYALFRLFYHMRKVSGLLRHQIRFFIGGIIASFMLGSMSNLFLPLIGITGVSLRDFGPVFSIIMIVSITYAMVKYRLMDIRLALGKFMSYALSLLMLAGMYILVVVLFGKHIGLYFQLPSFYFALVLMLLAAIVFPLLKEKNRLLVNRFYYQGAYNYHDTLLEASKAMTSILKLDHLLNYIVDRVVSAMYIERAVFYLRERDGSFRVAAQKYRQPYNFEDIIVDCLSPESPLLSYLESRGEVLLKTDLEKLLSLGEKETLEAEMEQLKAQAIVPVIIYNKLQGVFILGYKVSGEPYFKDDVSLLSTLSYQLAVSLHNSQLFDEVCEIKQYLENILENMGNGLIAVNSRGEITTFNLAAEEITGKTAAEVMGKNAAEVLAPELNQVLEQSLEKEMGVRDLEVELTFHGRNRFLTCNSATVELPYTGEKGLIIIISDVTRIKELEREKSQVERLASLGEMAAGIAHEVKNPLVSIKTFAELLPERYGDQEFRDNFSRMVIQEIERINKLIMELLNFSKSAKGVYHELNLVSLLDEVLDLLSPQLEAQKIELLKGYQQDNYYVLADKDQLKQAFLNICLNGIQAMREGGYLKIDLTQNTSWVKIEINDTGPGISSQEREKIFNPFYTTKIDGIGIGLSISHKIITEHGGTVQLYSNSRGTSFEVVLPVVSAS